MCCCVVRADNYFVLLFPKAVAIVFLAMHFVHGTFVANTVSCTLTSFQINHKMFRFGDDILLYYYNTIAIYYITSFLPLISQEDGGIVM